jgi:hypothetical protein
MINSYKNAWSIWSVGTESMGWLFDQSIFQRQLAFARLFLYLFVSYRHIFLDL